MSNILTGVYDSFVNSVGKGLQWKARSAWASTWPNYSKRVAFGLERKAWWPLRLALAMPPRYPLQNCCTLLNGWSIRSHLVSIKDVKGISKNLAFDHLNPSPFSKREGYKELLEMPII
jgi:hypothetical protein